MHSCHSAFTTLVAGDVLIPSVSLQNILADKLQKMEEERKDMTASKEENKLKTIFELTTEIVSCNAQFDEEKAVEEMQSKPSPKQLLVFALIPLIFIPLQQNSGPI